MILQNTHRVVVTPDEDGYYAEVPTLPGCYSWGDMLQVAQDDGQKVQ